MRISVVVPIYNVEKYLPRCINSIRKQSFQELEIILVDDGSKDSSGKLCDEYATVDDRIKVIHKSNGGLSDARNTGLGTAAGDYVCFIDSDDWIESETLERAAGAIDDADIVVWGYSKDEVDENENVRSSSIHRTDAVVTKADGYQVLLQPDVLGQAGYAWNKLYRTKQLQDGGWKFEKGLSLVEDTVFNFPLFLSCSKIRFIDYIGTHYIQRNRTTLGTAFYPNRMEMKLRVAGLIKSLLTAYGAPYSVADTYFEQFAASAFRSTVRSIAQLNEPYKKKRQRMKILLTDEEVKKIVSQYRARRNIDKVVLSLARLKWIDALIAIEGRKR